MDRMVASSSMFQVGKSLLYIPTVGSAVGPDGRVLSLPSLAIDGYQEARAKLLDYPRDFAAGKKHLSWDDINKEATDEFPASCAQADNSASCIYIDSSASSSSNSVSLSDTLHLVRRLTSIYGNQDSQSLLDSDLLPIASYDVSDKAKTHQYNALEGEICLQVPNLASLDSNSPDLVRSETGTSASAAAAATGAAAAAGEREEDDNSQSTTSSISPSHGKLGVPSKAAAILGAREIFTSPSHAAYRRLVDFTHRPTSDVSLLKTDASSVPSPIHPSLTARSQRRSKPDTKIIAEVSPEKKGPAKYKIMTLGIDEMKEKFNFLRKPGDPVVLPALASDSAASKSIRLKEIEKLVRVGKLSLEQIKRWNNSFEELLNDKYGLALFHDYLKSEYSEENIEFWIACEEFKTITNSKKLASRAQKIIKDFVTTQAPKEVNIDSKTRQITLESMQHPEVGMFDMAQKRIQSLMEIDSYQRFLRSDMYQSIMQDIKTACLFEPESTKSSASTKTNSMTMSTESRIDMTDSDSLISLKDIRASCSFQKSQKHDSSSSIIRISSVRTTKSDTLVESNIPPSSSENCLKNSVR